MMGLVALEKMTYWRIVQEGSDITLHTGIKVSYVMYDFINSIGLDVQIRRNERGLQGVTVLMPGSAPFIRELYSAELSRFDLYEILAPRICKKLGYRIQLVTHFGGEKKVLSFC